MTREPTNYETLAPQDAARIDATCDRFETAWKAAASAEASAPRIAEYIDDFDVGLRGILIGELIALDRACRERYRVPIRPEEYEEFGATAIAAAHSQVNNTAAPSASLPQLPGLKLLEVLGAGGMGLVFKARQAALNRDVAVKLLRDAHLAGAEQRERFHLEAQAVARLQHPNLVQVYEFGEVPSLDGASSQPYLVMEFVPGGNLSEMMAGAPQPPRDAARMMETLARAIHYAHTQEIIHRDLKPSNVLLSFFDGPALADEPGNATRLHGVIPKIGDFGLAKLQTGSDLTRTGDILGTPGYMAPEQTMGKPGRITRALDVYGLGAIFYETLTGRPPFRAETAAATLLQVQMEDPVPPRRLQPTVPRDLETICLKCLRKEPESRYATAHELAEDLKRFQESKPISAQPASIAERVRKWVRRRPTVAALLASVLLVAALGLAGIVWQWRQTVAALTQSEQAHESTRAHLYLNQIARAQHELQANHVSRAQRLLDEISEDARAWEWRYLKRQCHPSLFVLRGGGSPVESVAYSHDGKLLVSGSGEWYADGSDGELIVWDAKSGRLLRKLTPISGTIYGVAFHRDDRWLASAHSGGKVKLWDAQTGECLRDFEGHPKTADCVAFSPDGRLIASGCRDASVRVWDVETGAVVHTFTKNKLPVFSVAFDTDGRRLVACDRNGKAHLWDLKSGEVVRSFGGFSDFRAAAFSPDRVWLALATYSGRIVVWDLTKPNAPPIDRFLNAGPILSLAFMPNSTLAWCSRFGSVHIQDLRSGKDRCVIRGHEGSVRSVSASPDGRRLATGGRDGNILISDATAYETLPWTLADENANVPGLMFDDKGGLLALGGVNRTTAVWDSATAKKSVIARESSVPTAFAGSPDGRFWAWVADEMLHVRERTAATDAWSRRLLSESVTGLAYSANGRWLAWGGRDGHVRLLDAATGQEARAFGPHGCAVTGVAFDPSDQVLATAGVDGTFCLWTLASGQERARFGEAARSDEIPETELKRPPTALITRIAFSPDGRRLAAANPSRPLEIWDVVAGRVAIILDWEGEGASSVAWSADQNRLAAAFGRRVQLWDATEQSVETRRQATEGNALDWHKVELAAAVNRRDWSAANYHAGELINEDSKQITYYIRRGLCRALQAEEGHRPWQEAVDDFAKAVALDRSNHLNCYQYALLLLAAGDRTSYRALCAELLARFRDSDQVIVANRIAWTCCLDADSGADPVVVVALAKRAFDKESTNGGVANTLAVALYRAGQYEASLRAHEDSTRLQKTAPIAWQLFDHYPQALVYYQLGNTEEARRRLEKAFWAHDHISVEQPMPGSNDMTTLFNRIEWRLLRQEAVTLIQGK